LKNKFRDLIPWHIHVYIQYSFNLI
jgi:hypothetical protein